MKRLIPVFSVCVLWVMLAGSHTPANAAFDLSICADTVPHEPLSRACENLMADFPAPRDPDQP